MICLLDISFLSQKLRLEQTREIITLNRQRYDFIGAVLGDIRPLAAPTAPHKKNLSASSADSTIVLTPKEMSKNTQTRIPRNHALEAVGCLFDARLARL